MEASEALLDKQCITENSMNVILFTEWLLNRRIAQHKGGQLECFTHMILCLRDAFLQLQSVKQTMVSHFNLLLQ